MARRDVETKKLLKYLSTNGHNYTAIRNIGRRVVIRSGLYGGLPQFNASQARHIADKLYKMADDIEKETK
jgi:hypothetical protein